MRSADHRSNGSGYRNLGERARRIGVMMFDQQVQFVSTSAMDHNMDKPPAALPDIGGRLRLVAGARDDWAARIDDALENERFVLHAQPVLELSTDRVVQHELLIRMRNGAEGGALIAPAAFVPIAEQTGLIGRIDRWVIDRAAELAGAGLPVAINVSAHSIGDPQLIKHIESALARTGANPQRVAFEVTETGLIGDGASAGAFAARMRELGCKIALDDFGTGCSCLNYVKRLQADALKIDAEFVWDIASCPASRAVVRAIVNLARGFGMTTVAEGVEDEPMLETVRGLGVEHAQGYHIARPGPLSLVLSETAPC